MADYYPLISRAVANMGESTPEQRRALYERATNALLGQLRMSDPPISEADIARERVSLEDAVRRVESEAAGGLPRVDVPVYVSESEPEPPVEQVHEPDPYGSRDYAREANVSREPSPEPPRPEDVQPERPRPPAPRVESSDPRRWVRAAVSGLAIAVVVGLTAATAIMLKQQPSEFSPVQQAAGPNAQVDERKFQDRLPGEAPPAQPPAAASETPAAPAPRPDTRTAAAPTAAPAPAAPSGAAPIGVLQRALLVEEAAEGSTEIKQTIGRVLWRLDSVPAGPGEPLTVAVRADVDVADAGLKADVLIRRNRDAALPASHTVEMKFTATERAANGAVRDLGVPEMRTEEAVRGTPLAGIAVPVTENLFLVGLSNLPNDVVRNLELLRQRNWFMVPLRFANGRRALLLFEKGPTGDRTVSDAINGWQQG